MRVLSLILFLITLEGGLYCAQQGQLPKTFPRSVAAGGNITTNLQCKYFCPQQDETNKDGFLCSKERADKGNPQSFNSPCFKNYLKKCYVGSFPIGSDNCTKLCGGSKYFSMKDENQDNCTEYALTCEEFPTGNKVNNFCLLTYAKLIRTEDKASNRYPDNIKAGTITTETQCKFFCPSQDQGPQKDDKICPKKRSDLGNPKSIENKCFQDKTKRCVAAILGTSEDKSNCAKRCSGTKYFLGVGSKKKNQFGPIPNVTCYEYEYTCEAEVASAIGGFNCYLTYAKKLGFSG